VLVAGAPGSGKSTVAALVATRLHAALLDLDTATASMVSVVAELLGTDNLDDAELSLLTRDARYEAVTALAEDNLAVGLSVVMVAPFSAERRDPAAWDALSQRMGEAGATTLLVWVRISAEEVLRRVESRGARRDAAKLNSDWVAGLDLGPPAVPHLEVDGHLTPADIAEIVHDHVAGGVHGGHDA
jgi:predicted kinase